MDASLPLLTQTWVNERAAPELLPFATECVQFCTDAVARSLQRLMESPKTLDDGFIQMLLTMEMERIKFVLRSYLRSRLQKIETFAFHLANNRSARVHLSRGEQEYLDRYQSLLRTHFLDSGLKHLPESLRTVDTNEDGVNMVSAPNLDTAVVVRVLEQLGDVQLPDSDELIPFDKDGIYLIRYRNVRQLILDNKVILI